MALAKLKHLTQEEKAFQKFFSLVEQVDFFRLDASRRLDKERREELGQFFTPRPVAEIMAALFEAKSERVSILDAGAGVGALFSACVANLINRKNPPKEIHVTAYEIGPLLTEYLVDMLSLCEKVCGEKGVKFSSDLRETDFIKDVADALNGDLFSPLSRETFTCAVLNPPYRKIHTNSETRELLREIGIETSNLYTGFLAAAVKLLAQDGELVAITPRSFCNGPYFRPFREFFLSEMALQQIHLFDSREKAFRDDEILQETIIFHAVKTKKKPNQITITSSESAEDEMILSRELPYDEVVRPDDPEMFIRIVPDTVGQAVSHRMDHFQTSLEDLGISVSTGRVVDFRAKSHLRQKPGKNTAPLIYPVNLEASSITWPKETKKPQAIEITEETRSLFVRNDFYVLVKRFSSKEERKRIVAAVYDPKRVPCEVVGFENHLNYYHQNGGGLEPAIARGLSTFLNSTIVDSFFRHFNGHTQVNATDLRSLCYPSLNELQQLGEKLSPSATQDEIDTLLEKDILSMTNASQHDPVTIKKRIVEAREVLASLGLPRAQINERSALTLLALLDLGPDDPWSKARVSRLGITPIMEFMAEKYGKVYKPNTRETVRRFTVHQFMDAGLVIINPDKYRPPNSPKTVYEIEPIALDLLRAYGTDEWEINLKVYLSSVETLTKRYAQERQMARIPVQIAEGKTITLSPGGQNELVKAIVEEFAALYTPGGRLIYVGDTDEKWAYFDKAALNKLGVTVDAHGKIPDVIIHYTKKNWLVLIEAVTSHGPINPKRKGELEKLFKDSKARLVFVTAFPTRQVMVRYLSEISWETDVWVAEAPTHLIHFNGERFLGPY
ncbi:MAG: BsuBI/PstI family type II restriction endonuclease [Blastocatellia bacterium]